MKAYIISIIIILFCRFFTYSTNIVTYSVLDSDNIPDERLIMEFNSLSNENDRTRISFTLKSANTPFTIYDVKWKNDGNTYLPQEPFSLIARSDEVDGKSTEWKISIDFPFSSHFTYDDELILSTDRGEVRCYTTHAGELLHKIDLLNKQYAENMAESKSKSNMAWIILIVALSIILVAGCAAYLLVRRHLDLKRQKIEELSILISDKSAINEELQRKVDDLYGIRLDTLNLLCGKYFEKSTSDKSKATLCNDVENLILSLRDKDSVDKLTEIVNTYLDNIIDRVQGQIPELPGKDIVFLTYLYSGLSPRAVCILTDIRIKNFYNRRSRLKDRILSSDAIDKDYFVSKM